MFKFEEAPTFTEVPEQAEMLFINGHEVKLPCKASGHPEPIYRWRKDGVLLTELGLDIKQMVGEGTIVINKPEKYHAGVYQCLAKNDYGTAITQNITLKKAYLDSFPTFLKPNVHRPQVGDSLVLKCNPPKSHPPASVYWGVYKNQSKHNPIINSERISLDPAGNLYFGNVREEDNKGEFLYVCIAQNSILRTLVQGDDQRIIPRVRPGPPTLIPPALLYPMTSNDEAVQGRSKTLKCIFSGFPTPEITWYKNETHEKKFLGKGQELFIQNVTYNDEGHYVCEATSKKFKTSEDETAVFECIAQGRPKPEVHWFIDGEYLHEDRKDQRIDISRSGRLEFRNLTKSDFHVIQCTSKNEYGEILANMKLKILAEPPGFIIEPSNMTVAEDQSAMLHCKVSGAPKPHLMWQKSPQLFILSQDVDNDVYTFHHNGSLEIKKVSKKDQDVYSCYLQNKFGTTVSSSYLNVIDRTRITTLPISQEVNASSDVTFSCSATTDSSMLDKLEIKWLFNDNPIEASNSRYRLENNNELLVLPNVQVGDSGSYTCVAGNGIDEVNKLATLIVKDKPGPPVSVRVAGCSFGTSEISWSQGALNNVPLSSYIVYYNTSYELAYENKFVKACEVKSSTDRCAVLLTPYTNYSFHVVAINELGMRSSPSEFSTDTCSTPQAPPPRHPNKVCTRSQEPGTLVIEWEPMIKAEHYGEKFHYLVVYTRLYSDDNEYTSDEMETLFKPVQTRVDDWRQNELVIQDQPIYHRYNITVEAVNKIGPAIDTPKPVIGFSSQDVPTAIPKKLSIINETLKSTSVRFRWNQIEESDPEHLKGFFVGYRIVFWRQQAPDIKRQKDDIIVKWLPCLVDSQRNDDDHQIEVNEEREMIVDTLWPYSKIVAAVVTLNGAKASEYSDLVYFETPQGCKFHI
ncbi:hypothetical protein HELRODRAFT_161527 [Helobdella robusta]|uniref:Uncharacterized protein n=1 Tax=Helobdella robusta TaxID=6412 RepID=T1ERL2_HELRO|nr:hypothetical protein HELRODRAFT_161527 [Helobdella robusta]ESO02276.1 hypothetical protein HELRODRAFT_161527 [Helobdella robusta]